MTCHEEEKQSIKPLLEPSLNLIFSSSWLHEDFFSGKEDVFSTFIDPIEAWMESIGESDISRRMKCHPCSPKV
jgi:hypothetical protein